MMTSYEVRCGRRAVAYRTASTANEALGDYLRGLGCRTDEIVRMGSDAAAWRGAVYRAVTDRRQGATRGVSGRPRR